jgi:transposase InsO family protein
MTLGVSRSRLHERPQGRVARGAAVPRPTTAHRGALLNRQWAAHGLLWVNHKAFHRLLAQSGMLLEGNTGGSPGRPHWGQIINIRPYLRWTSDAFEIPCWNAEVVRVANALDTCGREVMVWQATTDGLSGEMIRDLMLGSAEYRFDREAHAPHPIEWLPNSGSCYRARETQRFTQDLGLVPCFTRVRSPALNGMAEAFAKSFKRDSVFVHDCPDAKTANNLPPLHYWSFARG